MANPNNQQQQNRQPQQQQQAQANNVPKKDKGIGRDAEREDESVERDVEGGSRDEQRRKPN